MYPVTQDFLDKIKANNRRVFGKVTIDYTDAFLDQSITVTASEQASVSYPAQTADAVSEPFAKIASADGSCIADGSYYPAPGPDEAETHEMGWWGSQLAGADGSFVAPYPTLTVTFFSRPITSLKVVGDNKRGEYPVDFVIRLYGAGDVLKYTETVTGNNAVTWSKTIAPVTEVIKMTLEVHKWSHPGRQAKILEFFTSIQETYEGDDVILIHLLEEREVSQGSLPVGNISANEIDIRLDNSSRKFDAGNTQSPLYQLLKQNRRIRAWLGVEAENNYSQNPPTFSRSSVAYTSTGTQVAANVPRYEPGKFGQAVMVEEGTTNLLTANQSSVETDTSGFYNSGWNIVSGAILSRDTTEKWQGTASLKVTSDGSSPYHGVRIQYAGTSISGQMTFSVYVKAPSGTKLRIVIYDDTNSTYTSPSIVTWTANGSWERKSITFTPTAPTSSLQLQIVLYNYTLVGSFYIDGAQLETKPYATSFIDGTRSAELLTIPTAGVLDPQEGTVECWVYVNSLIKNVSKNRTIFQCRPSSGPENLIIFRHTDGNTWAVLISNASGQITAISTPDNLQSGWHCFAVKWSPSELALFIDGNKVASAANPFLPVTLAPSAYIGYDSVYNAYINALIDDLRISSRARTDEEIAAAYQSGLPLAVDADTTYKLTFNGSIYPEEKVWVPLGTFWSGDWSVPEDGVYAQTTGRDRLELLRKSTYSTSQVQVNKTLYDLAVAVLQDAGLKPGEYWVDTELQQFPIPYAYFEPQSHREVLRKIAEACLGQVYCDRNGVVRVEGPSFLASQIQSVLTITADDYFRKDNPVKWSEIANYIEVETQPLRPVDTPQEAYRSNEPVSIQAGQTVTITAYYNETPCIEAVASLEGAPAGCVIQEATYYAWGADVKVYSPTAGTFTLVINARPLKVLNKERAIAKDSTSITDNGLIRYTFPANPLVQTLTMAQTIADTLLASFKNPRRDVEVEWRGNPALLLGDRVTVTDKNEQNDYFVVRQEIEYDGALRAKLSGRRTA